jgi:hypothetical protein
MRHVVFTVLRLSPSVVSLTVLFDSVCLCSRYHTLYRKAHAVVDGRIVTAQNPQSSLDATHRVLDVLRSLGPEFNAPENINKKWGEGMRFK